MTIVRRDPKTAVTKLKIKKNGNRFDASWSIPSDLTKVPTDKEDKTVYDYHADWIDVKFWFDRVNSNGKKRNPVETDVWKNASGKERPLSYTAADRFWCKGLDRGGAGLVSSLNKAFDRSMYHPVKSGVLMKKATVRVHGGWTPGHRGPENAASINIKPPRAPKVTQAYNAAAQKVTFTIETDAGNDEHERYDTRYCIAIRKQDGKTSTLKKWATSKKTKITEPVDLSKYITGLQEGKYVTVTCKAYARGLAGNNPASDKPVTASRTVGIPNRATVGEATVDKKNMSGRIKVLVTAGARTAQVQLERRHGADGSWETVDGATDNADVKALYDSWGAVWPNGQVPGEKVYYRVKSTRDNFTVYSLAKEATCLYKAPPKETCAATMKMPPGLMASNDAGTQISLVLMWKDSTSNDGCELSWSDNPDSWASTDSPDTATYPDDGQIIDYGGGWKGRAAIIGSLSSATKYYVRMRRYKEYAASGNTVYSGYDKSAATPVSTESAADDSCMVKSHKLDGTTAEIVVQFKEDNENTGTEITWSTDPNAWRSNEQPDSFNATWPRIKVSGTANTYRQTVYLKGLKPGTTYYVKARRYLESGGSTSYSPYSEAESINVPPDAMAQSADVRCGLVSVTPGADGKSAEVVIGWDGDHTGCEVTWSDDPDAWESSEQPSSFEFEWSDQISKSQSWSHTSTCHVTGLEEGVTYYFKARSYYSGDSKAYSGYTSDMAATPYSSPSSVVLTAPSAVARGEAIEVWWSVESDMEQKEWHIHEDGCPNVSLAEGTGSLCRATIPPERYEGRDALAIYVEAGCGGGLTRSETASVGIAETPLCEVEAPATLTAQPLAFIAYTNSPQARLLCVVRSMGVSVPLPGGDASQLPGDVVWTDAVNPAWVQTTWGSAGVTARLEAAQSDASDAKDAAQDAFDATDEAAALVAADAELADAQAAWQALSPGDAGYEDALAEYQDAFEARQAAYEAAYATDEGNALAEAVAALEAATAALAAHPSNGEVYTSQVTLPVAEFWDGAGYEVGVKAVEPIGGLSSAEAVAAFSVLWAHQAPEPASGIEVVADVSARSVAITLAEPDGWATGDVYDVWRMTPDGYEQVARDLAADAVITDPYAPFGNADLHYRISCRTPDGDFAWADFAYDMDVMALRFDWGGDSVELAWNVEGSASASKDFEARSHIDGSVEGYWNPAVKKSYRYSAAAKKGREQEVERALKEMASYPGPVFCRDPRGNAYQCNADLGELSWKYSSATIPISIQTTRVNLTDAFKPVTEGEGDGLD